MNRRRPRYRIFLGFVGGLEAVADLLEPRERSPDSAAAEAIDTEDDSEPRPLYRSGGIPIQRQARQPQSLWRCWSD